MRKSIAFYLIAIALLGMSFLAFNRTYREMERYSMLTNKSVVIVNIFQALSRNITNAAVVSPEFMRGDKKKIGIELFFIDSLTIMDQLRQLNATVLDSVNIKLAKELNAKVTAELSWLLRSNVPDSIVQERSQEHIMALKSIDSLIRMGINRTNFPFRYRAQKLETSIGELKFRIGIFLSIALILLVYTIINLFRHQTKRRQKELEFEKQEKRFKVMVENNRDLMVIVDDKLNILYRSPSAERITGFATGERKTNPNVEEVYPDDREKIREYLQDMRSNPGKVIATDYRLKHKQGHYVWLDGTFTSMFHDPDIGGTIINVKDITEQKTAERDLIKSERRFRQTLDNILEGVQILDFNWQYTYVNEALLKYSMYSREEMLGYTIMEKYPGVEQTELYAVLMNCMNHRTPKHLENEFVFPDGSKKYFELSVQPVEEGIFILSVDITERKNAQQDLEKSIKQLSDLKYALDESAIVAITDQKGVIRHVNDNFCRIAKFSREELIGQDHRIINSGYHPKEFIAGLWRTIANGQIWRGELRNTASDGSIYWVDTTIVPFLDVQKKPYQYLAIRYDITERKKAEEELQKSIKQLADLKYALDESAIVAITDQKGVIRHVNDNFCRISKFSREELIDQDHRIINSGYHPKEFIAGLWRTIANGQIWRGELRNTASDGTVYWVDTTIVPFLDAQKKPYQYLAIRYDITERKKAEEELQKSIKQLADLKYALDESAIVAITDQKGVIRHVNDNFCRIAKFSREELIGQDHRIVNSGYHPKEVIAGLWKTIANGQIWRGELRNTASDGSIYWVDTTIVPFLDAKMKPYQYLAIRYDISERKKAEEEINKLNRLYAFISAINQSIVHISDEDALLKKACDIAVDTGDFKLARIDMLDKNGGLRTVSLSGDATATQEVATKLKGIDFTASGTKDSPVGKSLRSGSYTVNNHMQDDPALGHIREVCKRLGIGSAIALPIKKSGKMVGLFNLSSPEAGFFDRREIDLLLEAVGDISFALDIFENKWQHNKIEEQVLNNERRFRALIEKSKDMKTLTNKEGKFVYASPSVSKTFGYVEHEFLNQPAHLFFHPDDVPDLMKRREHIIDAPGAFFSFRYRARHKKGHWIWVEGTLTNMLNEPGINAMVSNFIDISDMKKANDEKEFDRNNLDALINNTNDLLWSIDKEFKLITFNRPFAEAIKFATGKNIQKGDEVFSLVLSEAHEERFRALYSKAFEGEVFTVADVEKTPGGYAAEISFYPIRRNHEIIGTACHSRDISQRIKQENEREKMIADLVRTNKNLEQFTYIVSHNLRSPVANILGLSSLFETSLSEEDKMRSRDYMVRAVKQLDVIVQDLNKVLEVRAIAGLNQENVDMPEIVQGIKDSIHETIELEKVCIELDLEITHILSVKSYIYSIFFNLITNSIKYRQDEKDPVIRITSRIVDEKLVLVFSDNGLGMDLNQYGDKVFGLYKRFHLKINGKGMGLFMVRTQVETLNGSIRVKSSPGQGCEFTLELPLEK